MEGVIRYFVVGFTAMHSDNATVSMLKGFTVPYMPTHKTFIEQVKKQSPELNKITLISLTELSKEDYHTFLSEL